VEGGGRMRVGRKESDEHHIRLPKNVEDTLIELEDVECDI